MKVLNSVVENVKVVIINAYSFVEPPKMRIFAAVNLTGRMLTMSSNGSASLVHLPNLRCVKLGKLRQKERPIVIA